MSSTCPQNHSQNPIYVSCCCPIQNLQAYPSGRTNSLTQSNSIVNDHCHKVILFNHLCMISYLFNPRPWKLLLLPLSVGMLKPSYHFLIYGFSPQDNGWVRCGGYWPTKSAAKHFLHVLVPLRGQARQSNYLGFHVLKTIHFKHSKQKVKRINNLHGAPATTLGSN